MSKTLRITADTRQSIVRLTCIALVVGISIPFARTLSGLQIGELFRIWMCIVWIAMLAEIPVRFFTVRSFIKGIAVSVIGAVIASFIAEPFNQLHSKSRAGSHLDTEAVVLFVIPHLAVVMAISFLATKFKGKRANQVTLLSKPPDIERDRSKNASSPAEPR